VAGRPLGNHPQDLSPLHFHFGSSRGVGLVCFLGFGREREKERRQKKRIKKSSSPLPLRLQGKKKQHSTVQNDIMLCSILFFLLFFRL